MSEPTYNTNARIIKDNLKDGAKLYLRAGLMELTRIVVVGGLDNPDLARRQYDALHVSGVPAYQNTHPSIPNITVCDIGIDPIGVKAGKSYFKLTILYKETQQLAGVQFWPGSNDAPLIEGSCGVVQTETSTDVDKKPIKVDYQPTTDGMPGSEVDTHQPKVSSQVKVRTYKCHGRLSIQRIQYITYSQLKNLRDAYVGKVNASSFLGDAATTVLCVDIQWKHCGGLSDNKFVVTYIFETDPDGWEEIAIYRQTDGRIPPDVNIEAVTGLDNIGKTANGCASPKTLKQADFNSIISALPSA